MLFKTFVDHGILNHSSCEKINQILKKDVPFGKKHITYEELIELSFEKLKDTFKFDYGFYKKSFKDVDYVPLIEDIIKFVAFVVPSFIDEDFTYSGVPLMNIQSFYNKTFSSNLNLSFDKDIFNPHINTGRDRLAVFFKGMLESMSVGSSVTTSSLRELCLEYADAAYLFISNIVGEEVNCIEQNFLFNDIKPISDPFYQYLVCNNIVSPVRVIKEVEKLCAFINTKVGRKCVAIANHKAILRAYDIPIDTEWSQEYLDRNIIPFLHDKIYNTLMISNYNMCGLHSAILKYSNAENIEAVIHYGQDGIYSNAKNTTEFVSDLAISVHYEHSPSGKENKKNIIILKDDVPEQINRNEVLILQCGTISIQQNVDIFVSMMSYVMYYAYGITTYSEVLPYVQEYVKKVSSKFDKTIYRLEEDEAGIKAKIRSVYDDSETLLVDRFMAEYRSYLRNYFHKPTFSMLLHGDAGSGKTHFAKVLASTIFEKKASIKIFSMAEEDGKGMFINTLFGTTTGYAGWDMKPPLLSFIEENEESGGIILFDEIDKTREENLDALLNMLQDGFVEFKGAHRCRKSIKKFIVFFCSNGDTDEFSKPFLSRMNMIVHTETSSNKVHLLQSILNEAINDILQTYDKKQYVNISIDENILGIKSIQEKMDGENGRAISRMVNNLFHNVIDSIVEKQKNNPSNTNYTLVLENEGITIHAS